MIQIVSAPNFNRQGRKRGNSGYLVLFALALFVFPFPVAAQTTTSTIEGTIGDARKAVVAGAQVGVKNSARGIERTANTDENGFYRVTALPAGTYRLAVSRSEERRVGREGRS